ncbi:unnamed protein product [Chondrus crispus]|uniref:Uncharacterized protein n=1 Tax=Chondrus crispus TaxID=2769 RepID=R7QV21_CHOCR|nr:unnamed protein product [Chondrus crispus]CDF41210.1 unnamed protein product [Chondrus crispus]|eukprot:XP_005711504.1 unnamed protein product [Chondrus crispus]
MLTFSFCALRSLGVLEIAMKGWEG